MARRAGGLGRDMFDILDDNNTSGARKERVTTLRISSIEPRKNQPRKTFEEESLTQLAESIKKHGVLQPIIVKESSLDGFYEIIAGERRWRASKMAGLSEIPVVIFDGDELKSAQVAIIENVQRQDLNPLEEALGYRDLIERFGLTQEQVASEVGKSRPTVTNMMRLLELPDEVLEMLRDGRLSTGHARAILSLKNGEDIIYLANKVYMRGLSVRETEAAVKRLNSKSKPKEESPSKEREQTEIYLRELERKSMSLLGRRIKIHNDPKKKTVELTYIDNGDLEEILRKLCGADLFDDN